MTIGDELSRKVKELASTRWDSIPDARVIPTAADLTFSNSGEHLNVTVLYADIAASTKLVDEVPDVLAAEYYKAFLHCASQLAKKNSGDIQAYDGDRVMAIYIGDDQADDAVSTALELHYAVDKIINPAFTTQYGTASRPLQFTVGIDTGRCLAVKVGVRSVGEIAWIGGAANYAAKLNSFEGLDHDYPIRITSETFFKLTRQSLYDSAGITMWGGPYNNLPSRVHYRTGHYRVLS